MAALQNVKHLQKKESFTIRGLWRYGHHFMGLASLISLLGIKKGKSLTSFIGDSVFCSALGATIVANLTIEIGSYFHAGALVSLIRPYYLNAVSHIILVIMAWYSVSLRSDGYDPSLRSSCPSDG